MIRSESQWLRLRCCDLAWGMHLRIRASSRCKTAALRVLKTRQDDCRRVDRSGTNTATMNTTDVSESCVHGSAACASQHAYLRRSRTRVSRDKLHYTTASSFHRQGMFLHPPPVFSIGRRPHTTPNNPCRNCRCLWLCGCNGAIAGHLVPITHSHAATEQS